MNYKIIQDEKAFLEFIEWLPDLVDSEKYYLSLFARKKYCQDLVKSNDKTQLKRFTARKEDIFWKVKQLECEIGSYKLKGGDVPQEALVLYISPNPRDMKKATYGLIRQCVNLLQNQNDNYNIHAEALSCIQKSKSKSRFCDFDIDSDEEIDLSILDNILPTGSYKAVKTRGGVHILVDVEKAPKTKWHKEIREAFDVDQVGDQLLPVVGCCQGGFTPYFINQLKFHIMDNYELYVMCGDDFNETAQKAKKIAIEENTIVEFEFNGIICLVDSETNLKWLWRDYDNAHLMEWKTIGTKCVEKYSNDTQLEYISRRFKAEEEARIQCENNRKIEKEKRDNLESKTKNITLSIKNKPEWEALKKTNSNGMYSLGILNYAENLGKLIQFEMLNGKTLESCTKEAMQEANIYGVTGYMVAVAVTILSEFWTHGEELRVWFNKQYGVEGKKRNC